MRRENIAVDITLGVQYGDEAKGKITHHLASGQAGKTYTHVLRANGGPNSGHTIFHNGKKFITHAIPAGVFHGIKSIIGAGCVFNVKGLEQEIKELEEGGIDVMKHLRIASNAHVIQDSHIEEESKESKVGTTKRGIGPAYRDKYSRVGLRAEYALKGTRFKDLIINQYQEFYEDTTNPKRVLVEGAQGFYLDIDWGDYPFVTSSSCGIAATIQNGFTHKQIDTVYGAAKCYETYVGTKQFEDKSNPIFNKIREIAGEWGATTKRARQVNWLNIDELEKACRMNAVDVLVVSKMDILKGLGEWKVRNELNTVTSFDSEEKFKNYVQERLDGVEIKWSDSPEKI